MNTTLHNGHDSVSNHQPHDCLLNRLFRRKSKKISKLRVTGLCAGYPPETGEFPAHMVSNAESVSIWWRHHEQQNEWWNEYIAQGKDKTIQEITYEHLSSEWGFAHIRDVLIPHVHEYDHSTWVSSLDIIPICISKGKVAETGFKVHIHWPCVRGIHQLKINPHVRLFDIYSTFISIVCGLS